MPDYDAVLSGEFPQEPVQWGTDERSQWTPYRGALRYEVVKRMPLSGAPSDEAWSDPDEFYAKRELLVRRFKPQEPPADELIGWPAVRRRLSFEELGMEQLEVQANNLAIVDEAWLQKELQRLKDVQERQRKMRCQAHRRARAAQARRRKAAKRYYEEQLRQMEVIDLQPSGR